MRSIPSVLLVCVGLLAVPQKGTAEPAPQVRIATVDTARVLNEYSASKVALDELLERKEVLQRAIEMRGKQATKIIEELRAVSSGADKKPSAKQTSLTQQLKGLRRDTLEFERVKEEKIAADFRKVRSQFLEKVKAAARKIAHANGCVMTIDSSAAGSNGVPFIIDIAHGADITDQVISVLNASAKVAVTPSAP